MRFDSDSNYELKSKAFKTVSQDVCSENLSNYNFFEICQDSVPSIASSPKPHYNSAGH